ncbi:hypothetical protein Bca52824_065836 [Brassica carinata]|uniref:UBC core domain-containing protein n=1 Tax=Brassica carinata TaxID=52824 RepID=A0A8X7UCS9_BRACI|nr:hypothetical protein Bca52824_065836 [Brassica carinata]
MAAVNGYQGNTPAETTPAAAGSKQPAPPNKTVDSQSVLKRLQSELMGLMMGGDPGISAFPEEDNIFCWKGTITGSKDTVFEGTDYRLSLSFSNDYPFKPPKIKFETCCFHPNVDLYGNICLDILQDKWSSLMMWGDIALNSKPSWRTEHQLTIEQSSSSALEQPRRV